MKLGKLKPLVRTANLSVGSKAATATHAYDANRGNSADRGYGHRWRKERARHLQRYPLCVECEREGFAVAATDVDHKIPHRGDQQLFWDRSNWQSLCNSHHSQKTARGE